MTLGYDLDPPGRLREEEEEKKRKKKNKMINENKERNMIIKRMRRERLEGSNIVVMIGTLITAG